MEAPGANSQQRDGLLSAERERELVARMLRGDEAAFAHLIRAHLPLVRGIARQYARHAPSREDLVSEGTLGLVEATRRFDPTRGARLASYAGWWIRACMRAHTLSMRRIVRAPASREGRRLLSNLRRVQHDLAQQDGERPSRERVAGTMDVDTRAVEEVEAFLSGSDVTCCPRGTERGHEPLAHEPSPEQIVGEAELRDHSHDAIADALTQLSDRERHILERRYLGEDRPSLSSIGRDLGLSRERVRQLEQQARGKMRNSMLSHVA